MSEFVRYGDVWIEPNLHADCMTAGLKLLCSQWHMIEAQQYFWAARVDVPIPEGFALLATVMLEEGQFYILQEF